MSCDCQLIIKENDDDDDLTQCRRPTSVSSGILIHPAVWLQRTWATLGGAGSPSKTVWPGPRPTLVPSFIMIRPTICPQYTNVADRTDRRDRTTVK